MVKEIELVYINMQYNSFHVFNFVVILQNTHASPTKEDLMPFTLSKCMKTRTLEKNIKFF